MKEPCQRISFPCVVTRSEVEVTNEPRAAKTLPAFPQGRKVAALLAAALTLPVFLAGAEAPRPPNVLLIAVDDLNTDVGFLGVSHAQTPEMDRLASRSTIFENAHCQAPICGPSRNSFLTGRHPHRTGLYSLEPLYSDVEELRDVPTFPQWFRERGYRSVMLGKIFHSRPDRRAADGIFGGYNFGPFPEKPIELPEKNPFHPFYDFGAFLEDQETTDYRLANDAIREMRKLAGGPQPFFLSVGFIRPHCPYYAPQRWFDLHPIESIPPYQDQTADLADLPAYAKQLIPNEGKFHRFLLEEDRARRLLQSYRASISYADHCIGMLLAALREAGLEENTVVVLFGDHGLQNGRKNQWFKRTLWEASTRVPLLVSLPGQQQARRVAAPVGLIDLFPTLCEVAGMPQPDGLDGLSLLGLLDGSDQGAGRPPALTSHGPGNFAVRDERWRYIRYADGSEELYDHASDPDERRNLAGEPALAAEKTRLGAFIPSIWSDFAPGSKDLGSSAFPGK
jgi:arylsulfatase A-like enzyme